MKIRHILAAYLLITANAFAESSDVLTGDWGGARTQLEEKGLTIESVLTFETVDLASGGAKRGLDTLLNYDLTFTLDTEKAGMWPGGTFFAYFLGDAGNNPTNRIGDMQGTSNIESPDDFKLYSVWYEHSFLDGKVTWLNGLHDFNSEFDRLEAASGLVNSSFGMQPEVAQLGVSIFPITALTSRIKVLPTETSYVMAALYDGIPGDPADEKGTHIKFDSGDGLFTATEAGLESSGDENEAHYKIGFGGWYKSTRFTDFNERERENNAGWYLVGERTLFNEDKDQGLTAFFQYGHANPSRNEIANYIGAGLQYTGILPDRDGDIASFGVAHARHGREFKHVVSGTETAETSIEFNYRFNITPCFSLQPDYQYVINPGTNPELKNASIVSFRLQLSM